MAGRFERSVSLAKASWSVVRADKELLWLPVLSVLTLLALVGSFALPAATLGLFSPDVPPAAANGPFVLAGFAFYVLAYFIMIFFNTALVGAAMMRMDGEDPTLRDGLAIAWARVGRIFGYALIAATVGMLLHALEERVGWLGRIVVRLIGVAWTLATFLVVPVLVARDVGPIDAVKESAGLLKTTWGENLIGSVGLGFAFGVVYFVAILAFGGVIYLSLQAGWLMLALLFVLVGVVSLVLLSTLQATMQGVYAAALYRFATQSGPAAPGFTDDLMRLAFKAK
jgi:hypothetical protein